jgi:hypothetical protein
MKVINKPVEPTYTVELTRTEAIMLFSDVSQTNGVYSVDKIKKRLPVDANANDVMSIHYDLYLALGKMLGLETNTD